MGALHSPEMQDEPEWEPFENMFTSIYQLSSLQGVMSDLELEYGCFASFFAQEFLNAFARSCMCLHLSDSGILDCYLYLVLQLRCLIKQTAALCNAKKLQARLASLQ